MSLDEKYQHFTRLIDHNQKALESLALIRHYIRAGVDGRMHFIESFEDVFEGIRQMAECCRRLGFEGETGIAQRIENIEERAFPVVRDLQLASQLNYEEDGVCSQIEDDLFAKVERLSSSMRDSNGQWFNINNVETPHDLIRYFHQVGVDSMFSFKHFSDFDGKSMIDVSFGRDGAAHIIDLEQRLKTEDFSNPEKIDCKPLRAIAEFYKSDEIKDKNSRESFKILVLKDKILASIKLGCHYSEIEAQIGCQGGYIKCCFRDTSRKEYKNSRHRTAYVRNIFRRLGFGVEGKGEETRAVLEDVSEAKVYAMMGQVLRLFVSTSNLDMNDAYLDSYPKKAVNAFFAGVICMNCYLQKCKSDGEKDDE